MMSPDEGDDDLARIDPDEAQSIITGGRLRAPATMTVLGPNGTEGLLDRNV